MARIARATSAGPLALRDFVALIVISALAAAGFCASPAHAQTAEQTSSGMQITLPASASSQAAVPAKNREDYAQDQLLARGMQMSKSGQPADALAGPIAQVIAHYENGPGKDHSQRHYCARSMVEVLLYTAGRPRITRAPKC
jgi:hypothetical protein